MIVHAPWMCRCAVVLGFALLCCTAASGDAADELRLRSLAATCAACHGTDGDAVRGLPNPRLAGLPRDYFVLQMRAFREGTRTATVMQQIAKGFGEAQTNALAAYFERQAPVR